MADNKIRFGAFIAPFHPLDENPSLALHRDMELIEWLDKLGYEEAWIGEHHSAAFEIIGAPEVFIAAAIERTKNIRLGTGVSSLAYHHPLMLAERISMLDHLSRGRVGDQHLRHRQGASRTYLSFSATTSARLTSAHTRSA